MLWLLRRPVPSRFRWVYHAALVGWRKCGMWASARQLVVVAVTGTSGKSTSSGLQVIFWRRLVFVLAAVRPLIFDGRESG